MADERIEVEWIATATKMVQVLANLENKMDKQEKQLQKIADTSKKGAEAAAGSFNKLEQELKEAEAALKKMAMGTAEFEKQKRKVDELRAAYDKAGNSLKAATPETPVWKQAGMAMAGVTAAAGVLYAALSKVAAAQREIIAGASTEIVSLDTMARRLQIQAGLTDPQRQEQSKAIIEQASQAGVKAEVGFRAATQLAGSGFQDAVTTGTLKTVLDTIQATSFQGSPEELVSAFTEALNAYGLDKTNANLQQLAVAAQGVFKQTDFQLVELQDFAKNASVFESAGMTLNKALAGFTTLREVLPAEQAGTGFRNFVSILKTAGGDKSNTQALAKMGLTPEQVDFVGEDLTEVLNTLKTATQGMDQATRQVALGNLFGRENIASAELLIARQSRVGELEQLQNDPAQFMKDLGVAAQGMQAELNRLENERLVERMPIADQLQAMEIEQKTREERDRAAAERAAVKFGAVGGFAAQTTGTVLRTGDLVLGQQGGTERHIMAFVTGGFSELARFAASSESLQQEQIRLQREANELARQQAAEQAKKNNQKPTPPMARRPQDAPLPAVGVP